MKKNFKLVISCGMCEGDKKTKREIKDVSYQDNLYMRWFVFVIGLVSNLRIKLKAFQNTMNISMLKHWNISLLYFFFTSIADKECEPADYHSFDENREALRSRLEWIWHGNLKFMQYIKLNDIYFQHMFNQKYPHFPLKTFTQKPVWLTTW